MEQNAKLLVVDDDEDILELLSGYLSQNGFATDTAASGAEFLEQSRKTDYDLVILDIMMPGMSGLEALKEIRKTTELPVIMLSALSESEDIINGLEIGADDYLTKPFEPRELLARVNAVLRRTGKIGAGAEKAFEDVREYHFAGWTLDTVARHLVSPEGVTVNLSGTEYRLMTLFLGRPHEVLSRDYLLEQMQGRELMPYDRSLDVQVCRLRSRLNDSGREPKLIKTVRGDGYVLTADVTV
ncbi:MAG: response regulator transcription factor [Mailhella sp.]|nr:response regulator transcription factor [Mailhella sp.]